MAQHSEAAPWTQPSKPLGLQRRGGISFGFTACETKIKPSPFQSNVNHFPFPSPRFLFCPLPLSVPLSFSASLSLSLSLLTFPFCFSFTLLVFLSSSFYLTLSMDYIPYYRSRWSMCLANRVVSVQVIHPSMTGLKLGGTEPSDGITNT